ncbi:MAG: hypothetical protein CMN74_03440 [Sphingorhabdus sp.]|nr:hypothetical protein [Sphingorhabdus sp.]|tara:strand:- start:468 stop:1178 length:711 start_codon:yes stop_codon:yes gene_type:complete
MQTSNLLVRLMIEASDGRPLPVAKQMSFKAGARMPDELLYGENAFIIEKGVAATLLRSPRTGRTSEVSMCGFEGLFPLGLVLDMHPPRGYVVLPQLGDLEANVVDVTAFREWVAGQSKLERMLLDYLYFQLVEKNTTIACMDQQGVEERICRWLLMCHDRTFGDFIRITHEEIAQMISSYRPTVTNTVHQLEETGAIKLYRGQIEMLNRDKLIEICDGTYGPAEQFYRQHLAPFGK